MILRKAMISFCHILMMNKSKKETKFQLDEISKTKNYFHKEINQRKSCSKKLSKYVAVFYNIDKILIVLNVTTGGVSICSFTSIVGASVGIVSASFTLIFSLKTGVAKHYWVQQEKEKHDKILMMAKSKLNKTETLLSQALIDMK